MSTSSPIIAVVSHRFAAAPEVVFDAWLTSRKIREWFAPGLGEMARIAVDARVGGSFSFVQRRGMDEVDHFGTYLELERPYRLAFTWQVKGTQDKSRVGVDFVPESPGTLLTLQHELAPHWAGYRDKMAASWTKMLEAMAQSIG